MVDYSTPTEVYQPDPYSEPIRLCFLAEDFRMEISGSTQEASLGVGAAEIQPDKLTK